MHSYCFLCIPKVSTVPITAQFFTPLYFACTSNACLVHTECILLYYIVDPASHQSNTKFKVWSFVLVNTNKNSNLQGHVIQWSRYSKDVPGFKSVLFKFFIPKQCKSCHILWNSFFSKFLYRVFICKTPEVKLV